MKKIITVIALCALCAVVRAVPAYPGVIERMQPNGDTIRIFLRGDERHHYAVTEDGWQVIENSKGWFKYAKLNRKGEAVISCRKAHNDSQRRKCEKRWLSKHGVKRTR